MSMIAVGHASSIVLSDLMYLSTSIFYAIILLWCSGPRTDVEYFSTIHSIFHKIIAPAPRAPRPQTLFLEGCNII